jgi:hypothetical protein
MTINMNRSTIGTRFNGEFGNLGIETEINFQAGKMDFTQDIRAFCLSGAFTYTFNKRINLEYTIGADYLSGDKSDTDKYECFNTLYPAKHRFFGYMDYFTDIPRDTRDLGLTDIMAKARIKPLESISLKGDFHIFKLSQNATLNDGSSSKDLGMEIDFTFAYDYLKNVNFTFGSSMFFPGKVFKDWKGSDPSLWFYAQTTVNF